LPPPHFARSVSHLPPPSRSPCQASSASIIEIKMSVSSCWELWTGTNWTWSPQAKTMAGSRKSKCSGFFRNCGSINACSINAAKKDPHEGYRTLVDGQVVYIHPSSAIFNRQPEWVVYHELVQTTNKSFVTTIVIRRPIPVVIRSTRAH